MMKPTDIVQENWDQEIEHEKIMIGLGMESVRSKMGSSDAHFMSIPGMPKIFAKAMSLAIPEVTKLTKRISPHTLYLSEIKPETVAFVVLRELFSITDEIPLSSLVKNLVKRISNLHKFEPFVEAMASKVASKDAVFAAVINNSRKKSVSQHQTEAVINNGLCQLGFDMTEKSFTFIHAVTVLALDTILNAIDMFDIGFSDFDQINCKDKKESPYIISFKEEVLSNLMQDRSRAERLMPVKMPTLIKPRPWTSSSEKSGYWLSELRYGMVSHSNEVIKNNLACAKLDKVITALNAAQNTTWCVNKHVLHVAKFLMDNNTDKALKPLLTQISFPHFTQLAKPKKPEWFSTPKKEIPRKADGKPDLSAIQKLQFRLYADQLRFVSTVNLKRRSKSLTFRRCLDIASYLDGGDDCLPFYFPMRLDYRSRMYAVPSYLQPQGNDIARGLLQFHESVPIGKYGSKWLRLHGSALWGYDKISFEDRMAWVDSHSDEICASAVDPLKNTFWATAQKPFQALAFCYDWQGYKTVGDAYESRLPIAMDGTNNGLQNFSAALRDEKGGALVNLTVSEKPHDIYQVVADIVSTVVEKDAASDIPEIAELARGWVGHVTRKVAKRPTMTYVYGATLTGFRDQILDDIIAEWSSIFPGETVPWKESFRAAVYLAGVLMRNIEICVEKAAETMKWLRCISNVVSRMQLPLIWVTPSGFVVSQVNLKPDSKDIIMVKMIHQAKPIRINIERDYKADYNVPVVNISSSKQRASVSPNFIHSMDASHLIRTICSSTTWGINSFLTIHDSYGVHAGHSERLARVLRKEFHDMYVEHDVISEFEESIREYVSHYDVDPKLLLELEKVLESKPLKGTLDIGDTRKSDFFFS